MKSMFTRKNKGSSTLKPAKFIAPGELAKKLGYGQKGPKTIGESSENVAFFKSTYGTNQSEEEDSQFVSSRRIHGGFSTHTLTLHFGEDQYKDNDFPQESSYLDILMMCNKVINVNSVGIKVTDGDGRPLKNDRDVLLMMEEHQYVENIDIFLDLDETAPPILFKLPEDASMIAPIPNVPKVRDLKILGESKINEKVRAHGEVVNGFEHASTVQWFITGAKLFNTDADLQVISDCTTNKELVVPLEAVDHFLVAKFTPKTHDDLAHPEPRNVRGKNKNKKIAALKTSEKLEIQFYNNRAVGKNHSYWSRHLGKIVRDNNICPIQVKAWKDVSQSSRQHMWDSVKECFFHPDIESFREHTLEHMGALWTAWRSSLNARYVKNCKNKTEIMKNVPDGMSAKDWEWLVTNKFLTDEFKKISNQNSKNRVNGVMLHRTGSKPHRQLIFDKGLENETSLDVAQLFFETRQKNGKLEPDAQKKYDEIVEIVKSNPSLSHIEFIEQSFGLQLHNHVFCHGGGVKRKDFGDPRVAYIRELEAKLRKKDEELREKDEENHQIRGRIDKIESRLTQIEDTQLNPNSVPTSNIDIDLEQD